MNNTGCLVALLSSVKLLRENLERAKCQLDKPTYEKSALELDAMKRLLEEMIRSRGSAIF